MGQGEDVAKGAEIERDEGHGGECRTILSCREGDSRERRSKGIRALKKVDLSRSHAGTNGAANLRILTHYRLAVHERSIVTNGPDVVQPCSLCNR